MNADVEAADEDKVINPDADVMDDMMDDAGGSNISEDEGDTGEVDDDKGDDPDDDEGGEGDEDEGGDDDEEEEEQLDDNTVKLVPSLFKGRKGTVFFEYPKELGLKRETPFVVRDLKSKQLRYKCYWERNCVKNAFVRAGFKRTTTSLWNCAWVKHPTKAGFTALHAWQKINHYPGSWCIGRKDRLLRLITSRQRQFGKDYGFLPSGFLLPQDTQQFDRAMHDNPGKIWILKPNASSCGRGIRLITQHNRNSIKEGKECLVTEYVSNPYLINETKFDLRMYVLVTSMDPLRIYMFNEGLARFCTVKYSNNSKNLKNRYGHLTNYSINKKSKDFVTNTDADNDKEGNKWSLSALMAHLKGEGHDTKKIMKDMQDVIVKTLIAGESEICPQVHRFLKGRSTCFELYGFDLMLDEKLKPWLIEVNISPSLMGGSPLDKMIKGTLMADIFQLIGIVPIDTRFIKKRQKEANMRRMLGGEKRGAAKWQTRNLQHLQANGLQSLSQEEWDIIYEFEDEVRRRGHFHLLYPLKENVDYYDQFFQCNRFFNTMVAFWLKRDPRTYRLPPAPRTTPSAYARKQSLSEEGEGGGGGEVDRYGHEMAAMATASSPRPKPIAPAPLVSPPGKVLAAPGSGSGLKAAVKGRGRTSIRRQSKSGSSTGKARAERPQPAAKSRTKPGGTQTVKRPSARGMVRSGEVVATLVPSLNHMSVDDSSVGLPSTTSPTTAAAREAVAAVEYVARTTPRQTASAPSRVTAAVTRRGSGGGSGSGSKSGKGGALAKKADALGWQLKQSTKRVKRRQQQLGRAGQSGAPGGAGKEPEREVGGDTTATAAAAASPGSPVGSDESRSSPCTDSTDAEWAEECQEAETEATEREREGEGDVRVPAGETVGIHMLRERQAAMHGLPMPLQPQPQGDSKQPSSSSGSSSSSSSSRGRAKAMGKTSVAQHLEHGGVGIPYLLSAQRTKEAKIMAQVKDTAMNGLHTRGLLPKQKQRAQSPRARSPRNPQSPGRAEKVVSSLDI